jgi:radical SAM superfamily enzyme YgiQ (UPF0313 family)
MSNKKVALVLLPLFWPNLPPLGLAVLKGYLVSHGVETKCFDLNNFFYRESDKNLQTDWKKSRNIVLENRVWDIMEKRFPRQFKRLINEIMNYDIVGLSTYGSNAVTVRKFAAMIKKENPRKEIVLGGPEIARKYFEGPERLTEYFREQIDFLIVGEGEKALLSFARGQRKTGETALYEELEDPSQYADPDYSDMDMDGYPVKGAVSLLFSRGCVKKCAFCAERLLYKKFKVYPVGKIIEQIREYKRHGVERFVFHDSLINGDLDALEALCNGIISEFGSIKWEAQVAVRNDMTGKMLGKMKQSGLYHSFIGLESGSDSVLKRMNKGFNTDDAVRFFSLLNKNSMSFGVSIITGFPEETEEEFRESLDFVVRNRGIIPKIEQVNPFVYYEGIDLPRDSDYKVHNGSVERARRFIDVIDKEGFKYTKAFMLNLVEPEWK